MALSPVAERVGQVLGGRYLVRAPIGTGASASVYVADDLTLRRQVALKVLHPGLADDDAFLRRFQAEAQAAAALAHPHIVAVYDWGREGDTAYLVSEFLGGGSLRALLDTGYRLTPSQALLVGLEAGRGLEFAHRRGFVHRDIKPANLLFDDEGRLRIADFGLARALAEAAWTEPMGAVLGTARYASPEQARGEHLDGRSDVYSLAVVLIEAITGRVPFEADTTIGLLMARVNTPLPVPDDVGPLQQALVLAGHPDPSVRADASELVAALMACAPDLDRPAPLPLVGAAASAAAVTPAADRTAQAAGDDPGLAVVVADDLTIIAPAAEPDPGTDVHAESAPNLRGGAGNPATGEDSASTTTEGRDESTERDEEAPPRRRRGLRIALALLLVLALVAAGGAFYVTRLAPVTLADYVGRPVTELEATARDHGWTLTRTDTRADGTLAGQIVGQDPAPGTKLRDGATVTVTVSQGPPLVDLPADLTGRTFDDAAAALTALGLTAQVAANGFDENVPAGSVIAVAPDTPAQPEKGSTIGLIVSEGPAPRTIPDGLVGAGRDSVVKQLRDLGLVVDPTEEFSETVPAGRVIDVQPTSGQQVPKGSTVTVVVSKGPPTVVVPDVDGKSVVDAAAALEKAGLTVSDTKGSPTKPVSRTDPAGGTTVRKGTSVTLFTAG